MTTYEKIKSTIQRAIEETKIKKDRNNVDYQGRYWRSSNLITTLLIIMTQQQLLTPEELKELFDITLEEF